MRNAVINEMKWERKILRTGVKVSRSTPIGIEQLFFYRVEHVVAVYYRWPKQTC